MSQTVSGLDLQSLALGLDLKLKICECDMSLQTVESDGSRRKKTLGVVSLASKKQEIRDNRFPYEKINL